MRRLHIVAPDALHVHHAVDHDANPRRVPLTTTHGGGATASRLRSHNSFRASSADTATWSVLLQRRDRPFRQFASHDYFTSCRFRSDAGLHIVIVAGDARRGSLPATPTARRSGWPRRFATRLPGKHAGGLAPLVVGTAVSASVAEIGPPRETRSPFLADALLAEAVRAGWLTPPVLPATGEPPASRPVAPLNDLLGELDDDRRER